MGRTIVKEESEDLGEHIRVWDPEDALQLTQRTLGIKAIGGIAVAGAEQNMLVSQNEWLSSMPKLRLLWLDRASIQRAFWRLIFKFEMAMLELVSIETLAV